MALALWRRLFQLMDTCWAAPSYTLLLLNDCKCFGLSKKGGGCCGIVQYELFLVDLVWSAIGGFSEYKVDGVDSLWDRVCSLFSFCVSVSSRFKTIPLTFLEISVRL